MAKIVRETALKYPNMSFEYSGWELKKGDGGYVFSFKIQPNQQLRDFRYNLYENLKNSIQDSSNFNRLSQEDYWFHSAISFKMDVNSANKVREFIENKNTTPILNQLLPFLFAKKQRNNINPVFLKGEVTRIPIIQNGRITYEYDVLLDKILSRSEALSKHYTKLTFLRYRETNGLEIKKPTKNKKKTIWLISDTHFEHGNVIDFCGRPFYDTEEMNNVMISNWNNIVSATDTIYHLGDVALSKERTYPKRSVSVVTERWAEKLNGNKIFINGNHDPLTFGEYWKEIIGYKGIRFLLIHNPKGAEEDWPKPAKQKLDKLMAELNNEEVWMIHGHTHNNNLVKYPFINFKNKTINVSVELIGYQPINLDEIVSIIKSNKPKENLLYAVGEKSATKEFQNTPYDAGINLKGSESFQNDRRLESNLILFKCHCKNCGNSWDIKIARDWKIVNCECQSCGESWTVTRQYEQRPHKTKRTYKPHRHIQKRHTPWWGNQGPNGPYERRLARRKKKR
jgi:calcineurin-like phosphoesterase family protein